VIAEVEIDLRVQRPYHFHGVPSPSELARGHQERRDGELRAAVADIPEARIGRSGMGR
jgi:hypothetical protein